MKKFILRDYSKITVEAISDIARDKLIALVKYNDHGDEFLVAKTEEGNFEYGWFLSRHFYPDYDELQRCPERYVGEDKLFLKAPELYYKYDDAHEASNKICWCTYDLEDWKKPVYSGWGSKGRYDYFSSAQTAFDNYYQDVKEVYDGGKTLWGSTYGHTYHLDYTTEITHFLEKNDISTEENLKKLDDLRKFWRIGEIDGEAGKRKCDDTIYGDYVRWIWYRGKMVKVKPRIRKFFQEEYGLGDFDRFELDLEQFV